MTKLLNRLRSFFVNFVMSYPKRTLLIFLGINLLILPGLFSIHTDFSYKSWYNPEDPKMKELTKFEKTFGNDDSVIVLVSNPSGILNKESLLAIKELEDSIWETEDVVRVDTFTNFQGIDSFEDELRIESLIEDEQLNSFSEKTVTEIKRKIQNNPIISGDLVSKDLTSIAVVGVIRPSFKTIPDNNKISIDVKKQILDFQRKYPFLEAYYTGSVSVVHEFRAATIKDMKFLIPLLYIIFICILYYRYRSVATIALVFFTITSSTLLMMGMSSYLGVAVNSLTAAAPTILMTIALSDAVHLFSSFFLALKNKGSYRASVFYSLEKNFYPTMLTTVTTSLGFISFYGAKVESISSLGLMIAIGAFYAWIVTYFGLAPLLLLCKKYFKHYIKGNISTVEDLQQDFKESSFGKKIVNLTFKFKYLIVLTSLALSILGVVLIQKLEVDMDPAAQFKDSNPLITASDFLYEKFGYRSIYDLVIDSGLSEGAKDPLFLKKVESYKDWIVKLDGVSKVKYLGDILKSINKSMNNDDWGSYKIPNSQNMVAESLLLYTMGLPVGKDINNLIDSNNRSLRLTVLNNARSSVLALSQIQEIESKAKELGLNVVLTGKTPMFHELTPYIVSTSVESFSLALITITLVLILSLSSLRLGLLTLIPNLFPLIVGGIVYYLFGFTVDVGTVLIASVCLGIAVDDSIHFLFEYKKYKEQGYSSYDTVRKLYTTTFPALMMTTLLIAVGFASFVIGEYIPNVKFGGFVAFILIVALFADFIILPAIIMIFDKKRV